MICLTCGHYSQPDGELERAQQSGQCTCRCHPWNQVSDHMATAGPGKDRMLGQYYYGLDEGKRQDRSSYILQCRLCKQILGEWKAQPAQDHLQALGHQHVCPPAEAATRVGRITED